MTAAEFEERSYEAPLYNQLERGSPIVYTPGQVLESRIGFDRGLLVAEHAVWAALGHRSAPLGAALGYYDWSPYWGPRFPRAQLPRFRLNLFLQAKRSDFVTRCPRSIKGINGMRAPLWRFSIRDRQQKLLETLTKRVGRRAHIAYAAPVFHTNADLFRHTKQRSIVEHSTFPSALSLAGHDTWYYNKPGATGVANAEPEAIEEPPLIARLQEETPQLDSPPGAELQWLDDLAATLLGVAQEADESADATSALFLDDFQVVNRLLEPYGLPPTAHAYAHVRLFTVRYDLMWLLVGRAV